MQGWMDVWMDGRSDGRVDGRVRMYIHVSMLVENSSPIYAAIPTQKERQGTAAANLEQNIAWGADMEFEGRAVLMIPTGEPVKQQAQKRNSP